jgi:hypothetical protein
VARGGDEAVGLKFGRSSGILENFLSLRYAEVSLLPGKQKVLRNSFWVRAPDCSKTGYCLNVHFYFTYQRGQTGCK